MVLAHTGKYDVILSTKDHHTNSASKDISCGMSFIKILSIHYGAIRSGMVCANRDEAHSNCSNITVPDAMYVVIKL